MKNKTISLPEWLYIKQNSQLLESTTVGAFDLIDAINNGIGWTKLLPQSVEASKKTIVLSDWSLEQLDNEQLLICEDIIDILKTAGFVIYI